MIWRPPTSHSEADPSSNGTSGPSISMRHATTPIPHSAAIKCSTVPTFEDEEPVAPSWQATTVEWPDADAKFLSVWRWMRGGAAHGEITAAHAPRQQVAVAALIGQHDRDAKLLLEHLDRCSLGAGGLSLA